jgi:nucleotide-binding universal stress UspA family protein
MRRSPGAIAATRNSSRSSESLIDRIVDVADEIDAAVIVLGSRGHGAGRELFEGSVSHQVAEHAGRPVLIVRPPARRR